MEKQKGGRFKRKRLSWWISSVSLFFVFLIIFFIVDGTIFEPNLNDSNNVAGKAVDWLEESRLFNVWFVPFHFPWFNLVTLVYILFLLVNAITDILSFSRNKQRPN
uniref:YfzA family protein n=1 Tax=uncultured Allobacillus sp. TaxID=1638025 RepID=UPI002596BFAD|nr:YfzA family protein [uncultured Allobacillus sp.]